MFLQELGFESLPLFQLMGHFQEWVKIRFGFGHYYCTFFGSFLPVRGFMCPIIIMDTSYKA